MVEREQTFQNLERRRDKAIAARQNVERIAPNIGNIISQRKLAGLEGADYLEVAAGLPDTIQRVKENLEGKTRDKMIELERNLNDEIIKNQKSQELKKAEERLAAIQDAVSRGLMPESVLITARDYVLFLEKGVDQTPTTPKEEKPIRVRRHRVSKEQAQEKEKQKLIFKIDKDQQILDINGRIIEFYDGISWEVLLALIKNPRSGATSASIVRAGRKYGSFQSSASIHIGNLKTKIGEPDSVINVGTRKEPVYRLNGRILYIGGRKEFPKVTQSRIDAINLILQREDIAITEVIAILGPAKSGRELTSHQSLWAIKHALDILYVRRGRKILQPQEEELWNKIQSRFTGQNDRSVFEGIKQEMDNWFKTGKLTNGHTLTKETAEEENRDLIYDQAVVIASILAVRKDLTRGSKFEDFPIEIAKSLFLKLPGSVDFNELIANTQMTQKQLQDAYQMGLGDSMFGDADDEDVQLLSLYLSDLEDQEDGDILLALVDTNSGEWNETREALLAAWNKWKQEEDERNLPKPLKYSQPEITPKISPLERRDPELRQNIERLTQEVISSLPLLSSLTQVTREFNSVTITIMRRAQEQGTINPEMGPDAHPRFKRAEVVLLRYLLGAGRDKGLNGGLIKDLRKIVDGEVERQEAEMNSD